MAEFYCAIIGAMLTRNGSIAGLLFVVLLFATTFLFANAETLRNLQMSKPSINKDAEVYEVSFTLRNNSDSVVGGAKYGVRIHDMNDNLVYEQPLSVDLNLRPRESKEVSLSFSLPAFLKGKHKVFLVAKTPQGIVTGFNYLGEMMFEGPTSKDLKKENSEEKVFVYEVFEGSMYGKLVRKGVVQTSKEETMSALEDELMPGKYAILFSYKDTSGRALGLPEVEGLVVSGSFIKIDRVSVNSVEGGLVEVVAHIVSSLFSYEDYKFKYWILDRDGKVCDRGEDSLRSASSYTHNILTSTNITKCAGANFAGFIYNGKNEDGSYNKVASYGEIDFDKLASVTPKDIIKTPENIPPYLIFVLIGAGVITIVVSVYLIAKSRWGLFTVIAVALSLGAGNVYGWVINNTNIVVNMTGTGDNSDEFLAGDPITFSLVFTDVNTNLKPKDGIMLARANSGSWSKVVDENSGNGGLYNVSIDSAGLSAGEHTLNLFAPASEFGNEPFYGFSRVLGYLGFDFARFNFPDTDPPGTSFTIISNPPDLTFLSDWPAVEEGNPTTLRWDVSNAEACTASGSWSGSKQATPDGSYSEQTAPLTGVAGHQFRLECSNFSGPTTKTLVVYSYNCGDNICTSGEDCSVCQQDCGTCAGAPSVSISANPNLLKKESRSEISWTTSNTTSCVVTEDNNEINDSWLGAIGTEDTSILSKTTKYTLTCQTDGGEMSTSTTVHMVPDWEED